MVKMKTNRLMIGLVRIVVVLIFGMALLVVGGVGAGLEKKGLLPAIGSISPTPILTRIPSFAPRPQQPPVCYAVIPNYRCGGEGCNYFNNSHYGCGFRLQPPNPDNTCCTVTFG